MLVGQIENVIAGVGCPIGDIVQIVQPQPRSDFAQHFIVDELHAQDDGSIGLHLGGGFIAVGDPVEIKLEAYKFMRHGTARGTVETVSEGSFTLSETQQPRAPYFRARIAITELHLHDVPRNFRLIPGMTLTADIIVGRRSLISYLVEGALRTGSEAMREP